MNDLTDLLYREIKGENIQHKVRKIFWPRLQNWDWQEMKVRRMEKKKKN